MSAKKILPLIGLALFIYVVSLAGVSNILATLASINLYLLAVSLTFNAPVIAIKTVRWMRIVDHTGTSYDFRRAIKAWLIGFSTGLVTPGRLGDFFRSTYLKRDRKVPLAKAVSTVVIDRLFDVGSLIALAVLGSALIFGLGSANLTRTLAVVLVAFVAAVALVLKKGFIKKLLRPAFNKFIPEKHKSKMRGGFDDFYSLSTSFFGDKKIIFIVLSLTLASWILTIIQFGILAKALGINVSFIFLLSALPVVFISEILPISFVGVGTRDAVLVFFFALRDISASAAVSFSIAILLSNYFLGMFGYAFWIHDSRTAKEEPESQ